MEKISDGKPLKTYQVWERDGGNWYFNDYETLDEAVRAIKYGDYFITKKIDFNVEEV